MEIGQRLKKIRENKNFTQKEIGRKHLTSAQMSKIEHGDQKIYATDLIKILNNLFVSYDEFCLFSNDEHLKARRKAKFYCAELTQNGNPKQLLDGISKLKYWYKEFDDIYFQHLQCLLEATHCLFTTNNDYEKAREFLNPISDYLISRGDWFYYELSLFTNILYLYPPESAIAEGKDVLKKIQKQYERFADYNITRSLLINLAIYSLDDSQYYEALNFTNQVLAFPHSTDYLYDVLLAKIIKQIACFKLRLNEFDKDYLHQLVDTLKTLNLHDIHKQVKKFLEKHDLAYQII